MPLDPAFAIGVDYGTNSARALVVEIATGRELASAVFDYPSGEAGVLLDPKEPDLARQNPADYIEAFKASVREAVEAARSDPDFAPERVIGLGIDTTGSTPIPVDRQGTPLAMQAPFRDRLAAHAWLWKDHTGHAEAEEITALARSRGEPYLAKCGGVYSSEWFWSKILRCRRVDPDVFEAAHSWIELADFVPAWITGRARPEEAVRGICAAGHKAMYHADWGGLPSGDFLAALDPALAELRGRLYGEAVPADRKAGVLTPAFAEATGLPAGLPVAVGAFDAHMGAVGAGITEGTLVKIIGTSTCDMMTAPLGAELADIPGLCGIVPESVLPGAYGLEAGQSAVGDIFNWFVSHLGPETGDPAEVHEAMTREASELAPGQSGLLALDWHNGNRTILVDPRLSGLIVGQNLHTTRAEIYRALIEATAFGALTIINRFERYGVTVRDIICCGGIAGKNPLLMQIYADVTGRPMKTSRSGETCALGAAIFGAVAGGGHPSVDAAVAAMTGVKETVYAPDPEAARVYAELYPLYRALHDALGTREPAGSLHHVMKDLMDLRDRVRQARS